MLVSVFAVAIENMVPQSDAFFQDPDEAGDVVEFGLLQDALLACALVQNLEKAELSIKCQITNLHSIL